MVVIDITVNSISSSIALMRGKNKYMHRVADPDPVFLHGYGSGSGFQISLDPVLVFKFL